MPETPPRLLLADDDADLAAMLHEYLELQGFAVKVVGDGESVPGEIADYAPDLLILDVMLPGKDGFTVLKELRERYELPVIMLTARGEESDRILGLMHGADDYLPKPFNPLELSARVKAVLKRSSAAKYTSAETITVGPLCLNLKRRELSCNDRVLPLTAAELRVIEQLLQHPDEVLSRARLTELALNRNLTAYDRSIDTIVSKLRSKLADGGVSRDCIRSLRGHGYVLDSDALGAQE